MIALLFLVAPLTADTRLMSMAVLLACYAFLRRMGVDHEATDNPES